MLSIVMLVQGHVHQTQIGSVFKWHLQNVKTSRMEESTGVKMHFYLTFHLKSVTLMA